MCCVYEQPYGQYLFQAPTAMLCPCLFRIRCVPQAQSVVKHCIISFRKGRHDVDAAVVASIRTATFLKYGEVFGQKPSAWIWVAKYDIE